MQTLAAIAELSNVDCILKNLFESFNRKMIVDPSLIIDLVDDMERLLGGYAHPIIQAAFLGIRVDRDERDKWGKDHYEAEVLPKAMLAAVDKLSSWKTAISNNILHLISNRVSQDLEIQVSNHCDGFAARSERVSLQEQRQLAIAELDRRGHPAYDPAAYLDRKAWEIVKQ